jgi:hypothetical protein
MPRPAAHPDGHYYSPVCDPDELLAGCTRIWPERPIILGIDFNDSSHLHILGELFPGFLPDYAYPEHAPSADEDLQSFYTRNSQFSWLDCRALFVLLRAWAPKRIIEVGSGYSSLLMADVCDRFLRGSCQLTCIEPYPRPFLRRPIPGISSLIEAKVQDVPLATFASLSDGDVLFIDSSHVAKTGSDVNHLYFEVLPRLARGVRVHVHDIFLPHDYPKEWAIDENRSWNEQYLLRALLMSSTMFQVLFGCSYAYHRFPAEVARAIAHPRQRLFGGGSFWIQRS